MKRIIQQPQYFRAKFDLATINKEARTIDVVFATEREVMMFNWNIGLFREILVCDDSAGDISRLNNGAPLLDTHAKGSVRTDGLGVVERAWFENGKGMATVRFSKRADVEPVWQDVQDGCLNGISVGYDVYRYETTEEIDKMPLYRATKWQANEISLALVQADQDSGVGRTNKFTQYEVEIISKNKNNTMNRSSEILKLVRAAGLSIEFAQTLIDDESITLEQARTKVDTEKLKLNSPVIPAPSKEPVIETAEQMQLRFKKEGNKRSSDILSAVRAAKLDNEFAQTLIDDETISIDQARAKIIEKLASTGTQTLPTNPLNPTANPNADEVDKFRNAASVGLALRSGQVAEKEFKPEQVTAAREFRGMTLIQLATECLERSGVKTRGMDAREISKRAITSSTSDFPVLLENVLNKTLLASYIAIPDTWKKFCMVGTVGDFRTYKRLRMGSLSRLDKIGENGEIKTKKIPDAESNSISADTFANIINVSRKMIINDDLQSFSRLTAQLGRAAARSIEIDVYALLASNPTLNDGIALFHANHSNLIGTGVVPSAIAFDAMRVKMGSQQDPSSNDYLDLRPDVLLIGIANGGTAKVINDALYDPDTANKLQKPNLAKGIFNNIVDTARIGGTEYYAFANPDVEPVIEVAFLNGVQTPYLEQELSFQQLGLQWRVYLDYGVAAVGFRGAVKNPGA